MKKNRIVRVSVFTVLIWCCCAQAGSSFMQKAPEDVLILAEFDFEVFLKTSEKTLRKIDEKSTDKIAFHLNKMTECLKELGKRYDFSPLMFDSLEKMKVYYLLMHAVETKGGVSKDRRLPEDKGDYEALSVLVLETDEKISADFIEQSKKFAVKLNEKSNGQEQPAYRSVDMEKGEMIYITKSDFYMGRVEKYIIFSNGIPTEIINNITAPPEKNMTQNEVYRRLEEEPLKDQRYIKIMMNFNQILVAIEDILREDLEKSQEELKNAEVSEEFRKKSDEEKAIAHQQYMAEVEESKKTLDYFLLCRKHLELDKLRTIGINAYLVQKNQSYLAEYKVICKFDEPVPPFYKMLLDSGKKLQAPGVQTDEGYLYMTRIDVAGLWNLLTGILPQEMNQQLMMVLEMIRMQFGYRPAEVFSGLSNDIYCFIDAYETELDLPSFDEETGEMTFQKQKTGLPRFLFLLGIKNPDSFSTILSEIFSKASANPIISVMYEKRNYQGKDVHVMTYKSEAAPGMPLAEVNIAATILKKQVVLGSWGSVTEYIRRAKERRGDERNIADRILSRNPNAGFVMIQPLEYKKRMQKMSGADPSLILKEDFVGEYFREEGITFPDEETEECIVGSLTVIFREIYKLSESGDENKPGYLVFKGEQKGQFYEIVGKNEFFIK